MGHAWREVGASLKFNRDDLDRIGGGDESDAASERLLFRWLEWRCEEATIRRLSMALLKADQLSAIAAISP